MSYIVLRIYSFECDKCGAIVDITPLPGTGGANRLAAAERELRLGLNWRKQGRQHVCPDCQPQP
jgi:hypothetical protein